MIVSKYARVAGVQMLLSIRLVIGCNGKRVDEWIPSLLKDGILTSAAIQKVISLGAKGAGLSKSGKMLEKGFSNSPKIPKRTVPSA
ncbi:MAG: hypothetical protein L3J11_09085 [Draconibacterium sp.]|nr:hypothetical protein [Draconibacterium sp.]